MAARNSLVDNVFSWSLNDILNNKLYETKVETIPKTFRSVEHYLNSFTYPLLEAIHENVYISMKNVSRGPIRAISYIAEPKDYNPRSKIYDVQFKQEEGSQKEYKPRSGDLILLSNSRSVCIDDLKRPRRSITLAVVMKDKIRASTYITQQMRYNLYAVLLMNLTTEIQIWEALKQKTEGESLNIIRNVLDAGSTVGDDCNLCSSLQLEHVIGRDLYAELQSYYLNESQKDAVLSSILTSTCSHKNSVKLVWGPPGTGKTKTIASLLWALLNMKCRTLTCALTNIAVVEVLKRLLKLARESNRPNSYRLGDIVLLTNEGRMKLKEYNELSDVFLDYRVSTLCKCFAEWTALVDSMIKLLRDPAPQYLVYRENMEKMKERKQGKARKDKQMIRNEAETSETFCQDEKESKIKKDKETDDLAQNMGNRREEETIGDDDVLTFGDYVRKKFNQINNDLSFCISGLCNNVPSPCISEVAENMNRALDLLQSLKTLLDSVTVSDEELTKISVPCDEQITSDSNEEDPPSLGILGRQRNECLKILLSLSNKLFVPDVSDESLVRELCLQNATLIFSTASSSCYMNLEEMKSLKMLVVDEANQLKECELLIPLQLRGIQHAILVGDDCQLPAPLKSTISWEAGFARSLFERLVSLGQRKHLLNTQYRMHPSISLFPNNQFYNNQILDGANVREISYNRNFLQGDMYGPYSFINVGQGNEVLSNNKRVQKNVVEAAVVSKIVARLYEASIATGERVSVGIVSPYNGQVFAIQEKLGDKFGKSSNFSVNVRTIDGFERGEEDVTIISTVRSNEDGSLGFLTSFQRTNVSLTRARCCLWIVGNGQTLTCKDSIWKKLVNNAENRGCYFNADEDNSLAEAIIDGMVDSGQLEDLLPIKSLLFREARWKVIFDEDFFKSMKNVRDFEAKKEVISLLKKLSNGWRDPEKESDLRVTDVVSSQLLKLYEVDKQLILVWTVDLLKENLKCIQVLKFWDVSTLFKMPKLARSLNLFFRKYTTEDIDRLKFKCVEGDFEVPMSWEITPEEDHQSTSKSLSASLAPLDDLK